MSKFYRETEDFTKNQIRGIDLSVKATSKKYPFIKGWRLSDDYKKYNSALYIFIIVDFDEVLKFYNKRWNPFWEKIMERDKYLDSALLLTFSDELDINKMNTPEGEKFMNESYHETKNIEKYINNLYKSLPEELKIKTYFHSSYIEEVNEHPTMIYIERFVEQQK